MSSWRDRAEKVGGSWRDRAEDVTKEMEREKKILEDKPGMGESALRGAAQGASFGFADEATAGVGGVYDYLMGKLGARGEIDLKDAYQTRRDAIRGRDELAQAANPKTFGAAEIGGGVASALIPGVGALSGTAQGAKIGAVAGKGALAGGVTAAGKSEADLTEGEVDAGGVLKGAALGGLTAGALKGAGGALSPRALKGASDRRFYKSAVGRQAGFDKKLTQAQREDLGRYVREKAGARFGESPKKILQRLGKEHDRLSNEYDKLYDQFGDLPLVNPKAIAKKFREYAKKIDSPNNKTIVNNLEKQAKMYDEMGPISLSRAKDLKNSYNFEMGNEASMKLGKKASNDMYRIVSGEMDEGVMRAQNVKGVPDDLFKKFKELNSDYHKNVTLEAPTKELAERFSRNRTFGLTDSMAGLGLFSATGEPITGAIALVANRVARERGSAAIGAAADRASRVLAQSKESLGPIYPVLEKAAQRGGGTLGAMHIYLMDNVPEYRQLVEERESQ